MSDFEKQPWFIIPVIVGATVAVAVIAKKIFGSKESGPLRTLSTSSNNTSVSSMSTTTILPYGRSAQGIKKSKKHNRKTKKRR